MEITYINQTEETVWDAFENKLAPLLEKTLEITDNKMKVDVSIVLVDDETIHQYNKDFRNIDRPTDVLSFVDGSEFEGIVSLGDIIVSTETCSRQAEEYGHGIEREFLFLVVHGYLHLLGYDHMTPEDEKVMIALQKEILNGIADRFD